MNVYRGYRYHPGQHGEGLGNILGALFRVARPLIRSGLKAALPIAATFGSQVLGDVAQGRNLAESTKTRAKEAGLEAVSKVIRHATKQRGGRLGRRKRGSARNLVPAVRNRKRARTGGKSHIKAKKAIRFIHPADPFGLD